MQLHKTSFSTIIIGGGQAGMAAGYYLKKISEDFIILDNGKRAGDAWRNRWDTLRLFTPSHHNGLPGYPFPAKRGSLPTKEEMAGYLEDYAAKFSLPAKLNTSVIELLKTENGYQIITSEGNLLAENIIVCNGTNRVPSIPEFSKDINPNIIQIHSSEYKNPGSLPNSDTLVVGAGTSGVEIAIELSKSRTTLIAGRPTPHIPDFVFKYAGKLYWQFAHRVLTLSTPIGRKVRTKILNGGAPLISVSFNDVKAAGIEHLPRIAGVQNGNPQLQDGHEISVASIVWATGYKPDYKWIKMDIADESGWPVSHRGVSDKFKGLYFVGMVFQYGLTSGLVGGVGRDACYVVRHIQKRKIKQELIQIS